MQHEESAPDLKFLVLKPGSFPFIALVHLLHYYVTRKILTTKHGNSVKYSHIRLAILKILLTRLHFPLYHLRTYSILSDEEFTSPFS